MKTNPFQNIFFEEPKYANELLADSIQNKLEPLIGTKLEKNDYITFIENSKSTWNNQPNKIISKNLINSFEKGELHYINSYGTKNIATLREAKELLVEGYNIQEISDLKRSTIEYTTENKISKSGLEYLEARKQIKKEIQETTIYKGYEADRIVTPFKLNKLIHIDNVLHAQDLLDDHGLSFDDLKQFINSGTDNHNIKYFINGAYDLSPDRTNEIIQKYDIKRDTILQDGEDGFIRDTRKNNMVTIECDTDLIKNIAKSAFEKEISALTETKKLTQQYNKDSGVNHNNDRYSTYKIEGAEVVTFREKDYEEESKQKLGIVQENLTTKSLSQLNPKNIRFINYNRYNSNKKENEIVVLEGYVSTYVSHEDREKQQVHFLPKNGDKTKPIIITDKNRPLMTENLSELNELIHLQRDLIDSKLYNETGGEFSLLVEKGNQSNENIHPYEKEAIHLAQSAYLIDVNSSTHATQIEKDLRKVAILRATPYNPIDKYLDEKELDSIKERSDKKARHISKNKIAPHRFENQKISDLQNKELYTLTPFKESDGTSRLAIVSVKLDETLKGLMLVVTDERFIVDEENSTLLKAENKFVTQTKKDAIDLINSHYKVAALDPRFIEPLYVPNSDLYEKSKDEKSLPAAYQSITYEPVRLRTKKMHEIQSTFENPYKPKQQKDQGYDLDF